MCYTPVVCQDRRARRIYKEGRVEDNNNNIIIIMVIIYYNIYIDDEEAERMIFYQSSIIILFIIIGQIISTVLDRTFPSLHLPGRPAGKVRSRTVGKKSYHFSPIRHLLNHYLHLHQNPIWMQPFALELRQTPQYWRS